MYYYYYTAYTIIIFRILFIITAIIKTKWLFILSRKMQWTNILFISIIRKDIG